MKRNYDTTKSKTKKFKLSTDLSYYGYVFTKGDEISIKVNDVDNTYRGTLTSGHIPSLFSFAQVSTLKSKIDGHDVIDSDGHLKTEYARYIPTTERVLKGTYQDYEERLGTHGIILVRRCSTVAEERKHDAIYCPTNTDTMRYISKYIQPTGDEWEMEITGYDGSSDLVIRDGNSFILLRVDKVTTSDYHKWKVSCIRWL